ncbi:MBG domain-containing protein [Xanthomonas theicola]|uniref:Filamentous haemagglutinin FhaB/tRNA nuclease CdiA-like TPS domain-containing protein n=1 Tax=Xanthomonas theicola TaxID=56464 RepID=A0A2S6ZCB9_9XANT|nr:MBG domain-containing protein [Xanthomonas theicola]PPT86778.1 hypothetical protein XthCFBP4691_15840 [Xanthomonas theicola]
MWRHGSSNRVYRLVFDRNRGVWAAAPETARGRGKASGPRRRYAVLLAGMALLGLSPLAVALPPGALPGGGQVVAGQAAISQQGDTLSIDQGTQRAIIDWQRFDIGQDAAVRFNQPGSNAATLNRVTGGRRSQILGKLSANNQVYLVNGAGVLFGQSAQVDVGGIVASTLDIANDDFLNGRDRFSLTGSSTGEVLNQGRITATGGKVALLGRSVGNTGTITAVGGDTVLAAGREVRFAAGADGHLSIAVDASELAVAVRNGGAIQADGGQIVLNAQGANALASAVVGNTGILQARSVAERGGKIVLSADADHGGAVRSAGLLDAGSGHGQGGAISVTGQRIALTGATLDASGATGGGTLKVGGDWQGGAGTARSSTTQIDRGSVLKADATGQGDGGTVVVWSDQHTDFAGNISARGKRTGKGGNAEVSGKARLAYGGRADLRADSGRFGNLLLDPYNVTISNGTQTTGGGFTGNGDDSVINVGTLTAALANANVTVSTGTGGSQAGDISVANAIAWNSGTTLTLNAQRDINLNAAITNANGGLTLNAGRTLNAGAPVDIGTFILQNGTWVQNGAALPGFQAGDFRLSAGSFLRAGGGDGSAGNPYRLTDIYGVQGMRSFLGSHFSLANDIPAQGTRFWNCASSTCAGFLPIGSRNAPFTGSLDGNGWRIDKLSVSVGAVDAYAGLFGALGAGGRISRLGLTDALIAANGSGTNTAGGLVAYNLGHIEGSYVTGTVAASALGATQGTAGGLVGNNSATGSAGSIQGSYAAAAVSATGNRAFAGGLIGAQTSGTVDQSYATGAVVASSNNSNGEAYSGGLIGQNAGTVGQSYALGRASATSLGARFVGGLIGQSFSTPTDVFYATTDRNGNAINGDYNTGAGTGKTYNELTSLATFQNWDIDDAGGTGKVWRSYGGFTTPLLRSFLKPVTATVGNGSRVYNGQTVAVSGNQYTLSDGNAALQGSARFQSVNTRNAGAYSLTMDGLYSDQSSYDIAYAPGTYTVDKASATVTANSGRTLYTGLAQRVDGFAASGLVNGEDASVLTGVITRGGQGRNAGRYAHTASGGDGNYDLTFVDGALTIDKASATVTANSGRTLYTGRMQRVDGFAASGLVNGEDASVLTGVITRGGQGRNAGRYAHTASGGDGNYDLTFVDGALTIDKAPLVVIANGDLKLEDGQPYRGGNGVRYTGFVGGEDEAVLGGALVYGGSAQGAAAAGNYAIAVSGLASNNYAFDYRNGRLAIEALESEVPLPPETPRATRRVTAGDIQRLLYQEQDGPEPRRAPTRRGVPVEQTLTGVPLTVEPDYIRLW